MEESMSAYQLPKTDSIDELARFWDAHDLTDFDAELEEVAEPVFERESTFIVQLDPAKANAVRQLAEAQGCPPDKLIMRWVDERIDSTRIDQAV